MTRRRAVALAVAVAFLIVAYAASPWWLRRAGEALVHADPLERVDAMIVLASGIDRILMAADLYHAGYTPLILLTTDPPDPTDDVLRSRGLPVETSEEARRKILQALGVPPASILVLERVIYSTADEAEAFADWVRERPVRSVMIVTSPSHSARSRLTFVRALRDTSIRVLVRPSQTSRFRADTWWQSRDTLRDGIVEWQKLVYYRLFEF